MNQPQLVAGTCKAAIEFGIFDMVCDGLCQTVQSFDGPGWIFFLTLRPDSIKAMAASIPNYHSISYCMASKAVKGTMIVPPPPRVPRVDGTGTDLSIDLQNKPDALALLHMQI